MTTKPSTTTQTRELELLPCPFCGADARLMTGYLDGHSASVECTKCGCRGLSKQSLRTPEDNQAAAIAAWNTRATPSTTEQVTRLREALEAILAEAEFVGDAKQPFSTWVAERCRAALQPKAETEGEQGK